MSAYVRLLSPPSSIPDYIGVDLSSEWLKSSLLCTALETMTLPSRLREDKGRVSSLSALESALNRTGSRTLFELKANLVTRDRPGRVIPQQNELPKEMQGHDSPASTTTLDLDYSPRGSRTTLGRAPQLFSQVEVRRCVSESQMRFTSYESNDQGTHVEM